MWVLGKYNRGCSIWINIQVHIIIITDAETHQTMQVEQHHQHLLGITSNPMQRKRLLLWASIFFPLVYILDST